MRLKMQERLIGSTLVGVCISRGSTSFEFECFSDSASKTFTASTMFQICFEEVDVFSKDIVDDVSIASIWNFFGKKITEISLKSDGRCLHFVFEGQLNIYIWTDNIVHDNILYVEERDTDLWFVLG